VNSNDRVFIGSQIPGHFYGFNIGATWKNFDVSVFFQGIGDVQKVNNFKWRHTGMQSTGVPQWPEVSERWRGEGTSTSMPRAVFDDPAGNTRFSDRWVENAGFMRLKNFQVGYTIPSAVLQRLGFIERFRVYFGGQNVFTITNWSALDPENDNIPIPQTYVFGINATF
jgi:hypothetical protein